MKNYDQIFMVAVTHKKELFYSEFKEMWLPLPCFLYLLYVWGKHFQGTYIHLFSIKLLIWNEKGLTAAILGADFQGIKYGYILGSISLNII